MIMLSETDFTEEKLCRFVEVRQIFYKINAIMCGAIRLAMTMVGKYICSSYRKAPCVLALPLLSA